MHFLVHVSTSLYIQHVSDVFSVYQAIWVGAYWLNMLETISISASAAAIFSADDGCGLAPPNPNMDMMAV